MYLLLVSIGLGIIWIALRQSDDIPVIASLTAGFLLLLGGFVTMPTSFQIGLELVGAAVILLPLRIWGRLLS